MNIYIAMIVTFLSIVAFEVFLLIKTKELIDISKKNIKETKRQLKKIKEYRKSEAETKNKVS